LCIKAQKMHLFCPRLGFLVEVQAEPRLENRRGQKALFGQGAHNVFRVRLGKNFEKHELIVNFEVIFDRCQVRYIPKLKNVYRVSRTLPEICNIRREIAAILT
jgi:hypothetical protein